LSVSRPPLTPAQASARGRIGALRLHALYDPRVTTANSRAVIAANLNAKLLAQADPDGTLDVAERERRLTYARKAYFTALRYRRTMKESGEAAGGA
jgi:hypothetical protein